MTVATKITYCSRCKGANQVDEAVPFRPYVCEWCFSPTWNSPRDPVQRWDLTRDDRVFLRVQRIPEPEPVEDDGA